MAENTETNARFELQLYRNAEAFGSLEAAVNGLKGRTDLKEGEPALAIYEEGEEGAKVEKILLGIKGKNDVHVFEGAKLTASGIEIPEAVQAAIATLQNAIDTINGDATKEGSVAKKIEDKVALLKNTDAAIDGQFVTEAKEENGVVTVTRAAVPADKVTATAIAAGDTTVAVEGANVAAQIASLAGTLKTVEKNAAKYEVVKLTDEEIQALTDEDKANIKDAYKVISYTGDFETATDKAQVGATIKIYKDGNLKNAELGTGEDAQKLILTYTKADGTDATVKVDFAAIAFNTEFKDGLVVDESGEVKVKIADDSQDYLTVDANGLKLDGVQGAIENVGDTAVAGQYVKAVSQTDGKIAVERADVAAAVLNEYAKGTDKTAIAATDTINTAFGKLENKVDDNKAAIDKLNDADTVEGSVAKSIKDAVAELEYTDTAVAGKYISQVSEANGVVSVERLDVAAAALNGYVKGEDATAVAATDTINGAIGKLENQIDAAKTAITTEIEKLDVTDTAVDGKFVTAVSETDGKIEVTRGEVAAKYVTIEAVGEGEGEGKINLEATNVQAFAQEIFNKTIENEQVAANAINSVVEVLGSDVAKKGEKIEFNSEKFANTVINGATSFADADFKLAKAIEAVKTAMLTIDCGTY